MARVPGTPDQKKIYAIRSFGLNVIMHFSNERQDPVGKARMEEKQWGDVWFILQVPGLQKWTSYICQPSIHHKGWQ